MTVWHARDGTQSQVVSQGSAGLWFGSAWERGVWWWAAIAVAAAACAPAAAQRADSTGATALPAADGAARDFDYARALKLIEAAIRTSQPATLPRLETRRGLYAKLLQTPDIVTLARDNPNRLVGVGTTRAGRRLAGFIQLLEFGVPAYARIGNRLPARGSLRVVDEAGETVHTPAGDIAQVSIDWSPPAEEGWPWYWSMKRIILTLHSGQTISGRPAWALPISSLTVRPADDEPDLTVSVLPFLSAQHTPDDLVASVLLVGAPAEQPPGNPSEED